MKGINKLYIITICFITIGIAQDYRLYSILGHTTGINDVIFSPDGKTIASASWERIGFVKLWNVINGNLLRTFTENKNENINSVAFSPDGDVIAVGSSDKTIKLWRISDGMLIRIMTGHEQGVSSIAFNQDGNTIASGSGDGTIKLWSANDGELLIHIQAPENDPVSSVVFGYNGEYIASAGKNVNIWSTSNGKLLNTLPGPVPKGRFTKRVNSIAFSPDGQLIATGNGDRTIKIWTISNWELIHVMSTDEDVWKIAFSPDSKIIVGTIGKFYSDMTVHFWRVNDGLSLGTLGGSREAVYCFAISPDGVTFATAEGDMKWDPVNAVKIWEVNWQDLLKMPELEEMTIEETLKKIEVLNRQIVQKQKMVEDKVAELKSTDPLFSDRDPFESDEEYLWRVGTAALKIDQLRKEYLGNLWKEIGVLRGRLFKTKNISVTADVSNYDPNMGVWLMRVQHKGYRKEHLWARILINQKQARTLNQNWEKVEKTGILSIDLNDRISLAKLMLNDHISGYEVTSMFNQPFKSFEHGDDVNSVAFSPDGKLLATGSDDYIARVYDLRTGALIQRYYHREPTGRGSFYVYDVNSVKFSPGAVFLATGSDDNTVRVYDLSTGDQVRSFELGFSVLSVAFSPDGLFVAAGSHDSGGNAGKIYDFETGKEHASFNKHVDCVVFSPDGKFVALGFSTYTKLYNLEIGKEERLFKHGDYVESVAFSPRGKFLAMGFLNNTARLYNVNTGQELLLLRHGDGVNSVAFSPDGNLLATGSSDRTFRVYDLRTGQKLWSFEHDSGVSSVEFSPDGRYIAVGCNDNNAYLYRNVFESE